MTKRKLRKEVKYALYSVGIISLFGFLYLMDGISFKSKLEDNNNDIKYVDDTIFDETVPVISTETVIMRPYSDTTVTILKDFYDYQASEDEQKNSIIYYENTYMPNTGISYNANNSFEVLSILAGEVTSVTEDGALGNIVQITHENDIISVYQSLSEINVKKGDTVIQGQVIGKSGTCNVLKDSENNLYFELIIKGMNVDPENYFNKLVSEI